MASAVLTAMRTASALSTGSAPGNPRQVAHTFVFGGSPNEVGHAQNSFERVRSCAWTSRPMTACQDVPGMRSDTLVLIELEHDFRLTDEAELLAGDALDGRRLLAQLLHLGTQLRDVAAQLGVLGLHLRELLLE